jgi:hypothetical protein
MSNYLFCKFNDVEAEALHSELSKVFSITRTELESLYENYRTEFDLKNNTIQTLSRDIFCSDDKIFQKSYDEALAIGIDIPSIFEIDNGILDKGTVFIVGQDLLRSNEKPGEIEIGTPYALHSKCCRAKRNPKLYFTLTKVLLNKGYRVYLTDIFKIWVSKSNRGNNKLIRNPLQVTDGRRFAKVLGNEVNIFKPLKVIAWGDDASNALKGQEIDHLKFTHPAYRGISKKMNNKKASHENIKAFWEEFLMTARIDL